MANTTTNATLTSEYHVPIPFAFTTLILAAFGIAGNGLIVLTTLVKRHIQGASSVLIATLALFDLGSNVGMCMVGTAVV